MEGDDSPVVLGPWQIVAAAALILVQIVISAGLRLGLQVQLLVGALRCIAQLSILGYILVPIFSCDRWYVVVAYSLFMATVSAVEAIGRPAHRYKGMLAEVLGIVLGASGLVIAFAVLLVLRVRPWYTPQYVIPVLGMVLGNTISAISVGLSTALEELATRPDAVERLLALGATRVEATQDLVKRSLSIAMTPMLNQMNVVGLVSIPGMMTGQIMAGADPAQAARYQIAIMFLLGAASTLGAVGAVLAAVLTAVDTCHRVRTDRLTPKQRGAGINALITAGMRRVGTAGTRSCSAIEHAMCRCFGVGRARDSATSAGQQDAGGDDEDVQPLLLGHPPHRPTPPTRL